jgi:hypothetical protein
MAMWALSALSLLAAWLFAPSHGPSRRDTWLLFGGVAAFFAIAAMLVRGKQVEIGSPRHARSPAPDARSCLAHWTYSAEELRGFLRWKKARCRRHLVWLPALGAIVGAGAAYTHADAWPGNSIPYTGAGLAAGAALTAAFWVVVWRDEARILAPPCDVVIDSLGYEIADERRPFGNLRSTITHARVLPATPRILEVAHMTVGTLPENSSSGKAWIPVPAGKEAEAEQVAAALRRRDLRTS